MLLTGLDIDDIHPPFAWCDRLLLGANFQPEPVKHTVIPDNITPEQDSLGVTAIFWDFLIKLTEIGFVVAFKYY
ncbi:hypothetical protein BZZ01_15775 [Nostocales cyanobacterium HT-58-2]|nr:hypothetical protein BZZ01_15775 [Nostocales cyanobacterium HT-58-2]